jgi:hypothetical protein
MPIPIALRAFADAVCTWLTNRMPTAWNASKQPENSADFPIACGDVALQQHQADDAAQQVCGMIKNWAIETNRPALS